MHFSLKKLTGTLALCCGLAILFNACSKSGSPSTDPVDSGDYSYVLFTNEGDLATPGYMTSYHEMPSGDLSNISKNTLQMKSAFGFTQYGNWIFNRTSISGDAGIQKLTVSQDGSLKDAGFLSNGEMFHIVSPTQGYYLDESRGTMLLQIFNPTTMARTGQIDLSSLEMDGVKYQAAGKHIIASKEGKLFVGLTYGAQGANPGYGDDVVDYIAMAVIDINTGTLEKEIKYPGMKSLGWGASANKMWTLGDDGALYFYGTGFSEGLSNSAIIRIKKGETDFDKDWILKADNYQQHGSFGTALVKNGKIYVQIPSEPLKADFSNLQNAIWDYYAIDVNSLQATKIGGMPQSRYAHSNEQCITEIDGNIYLWMANAAKKENGYYLLDPSSNTAKKSFNVTDGGLVSGFMRLEK